ncbi:MAG TPA: hypothetical protein PLH01_07715, partial [Kiritimatiellia bacterium]|nr:hypothetical protein [Kiritimatiellia bacterium]HPK38151.1 hypothetical protein [Kiritimatiellia bacterium]
PRFRHRRSLFRVSGFLVSGFQGFKVSGFIGVGIAIGIGIGVGIAIGIGVDIRSDGRSGRPCPLADALGAP